MKHFVNIFVLLLLAAFIVGLTLLICTLPPNPKDPSAWGVLYLPAIGLFFMWLYKLNEDY